jgi:macrolide transport system ATP-binding/permease protein
VRRVLSDAQEVQMLSRLFKQLSILFSRRRFRSELDEEMKFHRAQAQQEFVAGGMTPEAARYAAMQQFGNAAKLQEQSHEAVAFRVETVLQDLRFALRQWGKNPGFALTAILILALGMGASVAIFAFVDAALLEPLPYADPGRLMSVNESSVESPRWPLSYPDYVDWQRLNKSFSSLDVYGGMGFLLHTASGAEPVQGERVSGSFFHTLGVRPMLGRDFYPGENRPDGPNVALLSYRTWLQRFAARRDVVGQAVDLDDKAYTIIGVLPPRFSFAPGGNAEFWVPINVLSTHEHSRTFYNFWGIGRLRDGVTKQAANAEMTAIARQLQRQYGLTKLDLSASVVPLSEIIVGDVRPILLTLLGGSGLLLLIACVNVASLVLVRSESRRREIAVRGALGATPLRLVRQFLSEGLLLALLGSLGGIVVAAATMRLLGRLVPKDMASNLPFLEGVRLNLHTAVFAAAIALLAAVLLALTPALRLSLQRVREGLTDGDFGAAGQHWRRLGANLVVIEMAIAVVLLAGAGLLGQSLYRLLHVPLGFDPNHLASVRVMANGAAYQSDEQTEQLYREIVRRAASIPGAQSAGLTSMLPVECNCAIDRIHFPGRPYHGEHNDVNERHVSAEYLSTLKASLQRGRFFTDAENASRPGVAVINQALARKYFPDEDPIGKVIANDEMGRPSEWEIVGVVDDVREGPLDVDISPAEYFPINQTHERSFSLVVRTRQDAAGLLPELVSTLHQIDPDLGLSDEATMNEKIEATQAALLHRFSAWLVGGFAAMALTLGVIGLYGVIAYSVSRRTREIGVRMALGAQRSRVYTLVMRQAGWLTAIGLAIGLVCSVGTSLMIRKMLFGVQAWDPLTLGCVALLLGLASLAASFLPARRAASVNPTDALRAE